MQGAPVGELRSYKLHDTAKKKKGINLKTRDSLEWGFQNLMDVVTGNCILQLLLT